MLNATFDMSAENKLNRNCQKRNVLPLVFQSVSEVIGTPFHDSVVNSAMSIPAARRKIVLVFFCTDTSFMYIIVCLGIVKLYQTRHPDIAAHAHLVYAGFAAIILVAMIGVVSD